MGRKLDLRVVRLEQWPVADQAAWRAACRKGDWFARGGALGSFSSSRLEQAEAAYGRWLGFLATTESISDLASGLPLFTLDRVRIFYERLGAVLAPMTVRHYMHDLWTAARAMAPGQTFEYLAAATHHILMTAEPVMDPHDRIVPARDLFALGLDLMGAAAQHSATPRQLGFYRDGLMIAMLAACPLRLGNLATIGIDCNLTKCGDRYRLAFPANEVKNRRALDYLLPAALTACIDRYLEHDRPILLRRDGRWRQGDPGQAFWISRDGTKMTSKPMADRIRARTRARFGFPINPHRIRHIAATSTAVEMPEHIGIVQSVLGHASPRTAERYYNQAHSLQAARRYQSVIEEFLAESDGKP